MTGTEPSFLRKATPPPRRRGPVWPGALLASGLLLLLLLQVAIADRARLAADPAWRPRVALLCRLLGCQLPAWRQPEAFRVTAREVRPHPSAADALLITASFRNDAAFDQAWPRLEIRLADLDGQALGQREFAPRDYLGSDPDSAVIAPGQSASATLEILDPGKRAVAFTLDFH